MGNLMIVRVVVQSYFELLTSLTARKSCLFMYHLALKMPAEDTTCISQRQLHCLQAAMEADCEKRPPPGPGGERDEKRETLDPWGAPWVLYESPQSVGMCTYMCKYLGEHPES